MENLHVYHRDREGACRPLAEGTADWHAYFAAAQKDGTQRYATLEFVMGDNEEQFLQDAAALHVLLKEEFDENRKEVYLYVWYVDILWF